MSSNRPRLARSARILLGLSLLLGPASLCQGATMLSFLKIGAGARAVALGDAVVSRVQDPSATYWNPGALPFVTGTQAELMHNESYQGVRYEFISLTRQSGRNAAGASFNGIWTDYQRAYDAAGEFQGEFAYYGLAISGNYGYRLRDNVGIGAGVEYLREAIDVFSTEGLAVTLGIQAREVLPHTDAGLAVLHLGSSMKYEAQSYPLPTTIQGGLTHTIPIGPLAGDVSLAAEVRKVRDEDTQLLFGTEYQYQHTARLQVGYHGGLDTQGLSLGMGFGSGKLRGQYAFVPSKDDLGDQHRISLLLVW